MEIVSIDSPDTPELENLVDTFSQQMSDIGSPKSRDDIQAAILNALKPDSRAIIFLAKQDTIPIGTVLANICSGIESGGDYIWINEIQITPGARGEGYGRQLLHHVLEWSKSNNIKSVLGVAGTNNIASQALFKSQGFGIDDIKWMSTEL